MLNDFIYLQRGKKSSLHLLREDLASKNVANLVNVLLKALFYKLWWDDSSLIIVRRLNLCFLIDIWLTWWVLECTTFKCSLLRQFYEIETVFFQVRPSLKQFTITGLKQLQYWQMINLRNEGKILENLGQIAIFGSIAKYFDDLWSRWLKKSSERKFYYLSNFTLLS